jgi:hypothetical protein
MVKSLREPPQRATEGCVPFVAEADSLNSKTTNDGRRRANDGKRNNDNTYSLIGER